MRKVEFGEGETMFSEGDPSTQGYKIVSGEVEIRLRVPSVIKRGRVMTIATCGPGETVGEMGAIEKSRRSATAVATKPTVCIAYAPGEFAERLKTDPEEAINYVRMLIRRTRRAYRVIARSATQAR